MFIPDSCYVAGTVLEQLSRRLEKSVITYIKIRRVTNVFNVADPDFTMVCGLVEIMVSGLGEIFIGFIISLYSTFCFRFRETLPHPPSPV